MGHINLALLGVLGLVQTVFLPGYLILRLLRLGSGLIEGIVLSFGLSLIVNYLLVAALASLGFYRSTVIYALFIGELLLWARLDFRRLEMPLGEAMCRATWRAARFLREIDQRCPVRS